MNNLRKLFANTKGFTLIELLVVIAIIAILAAILFPVFAQARSKARKSTCLNNIKQLTLATIMYADDYDQMRPPWNLGDNASCWDPAGVPADYSNPGWPVKYMRYVGLAPYIKNQKVFFCPEAMVKMNPNDSGWDMYWNYNCNFAGQLLDLQNVAAADSVLIYDAARTGWGDIGTFWSNLRTNHPGAGGYPEGANIGFADGHAKWSVRSTSNTTVYWTIGN